MIHVLNCTLAYGLARNTLYISPFSDTVETRRTVTLYYHSASLPLGAVLSVFGCAILMHIEVRRTSLVQDIVLEMSSLRPIPLSEAAEVGMRRVQKWPHHGIIPSRAERLYCDPRFGGLNFDTKQFGNVIRSKSGYHPRSGLRSILRRANRDILLLLNKPVPHSYYHAQEKVSN